MARNEIVAPRGSRFVVLASMCVVVVALWFMQDVLIPVALSVLVSFLLAPLVHRLERFGLGRIGSVLAVIVASLALIVVLGYVVGNQLWALAANADSYTENIRYKIASVRDSGGGGEALSTLTPSGGIPRGSNADAGGLGDGDDGMLGPCWVVELQEAL